LYVDQQNNFVNPRKSHISDKRKGQNDIISPAGLLHRSAFVHCYLRHLGSRKRV